MPAHPQVREAQPAEFEALAALTASTRDAVAASPDTPGIESIPRHLSAYLASGGKVLVADLDGELVGLLLARQLGPHLFSDVDAWIIDSLFVALHVRRRGIGHALVAGVAAFAGEAGTPYVYAGTLATDRGMQRFLARLGFASAAGHRVVPTPVLLRNLAENTGVRGRRDSTRAAIDQVIARRRRTRDADTAAAGLDLRSLH